MSFKGKIKKMIPDGIYLRYRFKKALGYSLNLKNPRTFQEKLQWLKLNNRHSIYSIMVDKYAVKKYVAEKIGIEYIIQNYGVWSSFDEIDFNKLPNQFVLKCTHDSGGLVVCKDKSMLDLKKVKSKIDISLRREYYYCSREWPYKNVKPRIIAEKYIADNPNDYKFFCFNGEPKMVEVCSDRFTETGTKMNFYDTNWKPLKLSLDNYKVSEVFIPKPEKLELMISLAKKLSSNIPFSRIDFYEVNGKVLFGEITFFPTGGFKKFSPDKWNITLGDWIELK